MTGSLSGCLAAAGYFCFFQLCGVALSGALLSREGLGVRLLLGSVAGSVMLQWLPALGAFVWGFTLPAHLAALALAAVLAGGAV